MLFGMEEASRPLFATHVILEKYGFTAQGKCILANKLAYQLRTIFLANNFEEFFSLADALGSETRPWLYAFEVDNKQAIHWAAYHGNIPAMQKLLHRGVSINSRTKSGITPLHFAASRNKIDAMQFLISSGANFLSQTNIDASMPLHYAAARGHCEAIECLVTAGAPFTVSTEKNCTALTLAFKHEYTEAFYCLVKYGAFIGHHPYWWQKEWTLLHYAADLGSVAALKYLLDAGEYIDLINYRQETPLHIAARKGHLDAIHYLVQCGAALEAKNNDSDTPLHAAARSCCISSMQCLIELGAKKNVYNKAGFMPIHVAIMNGCNDPALVDCFDSDDRNAATTLDSMPIHFAAGHRTSDVLYRLRELGTDIYSEKNAFDFDDAHIMAVILRFEDICSPNSRREQGNTLLIEAAAQDFKYIVKELLSDERLEVNSRNSEGNTALHVAAREGHVDIVKLLLLDNRCHKYTKNDEGDTAFHLAVQNNQLKVVECFLHYNTITQWPLNYRQRSVKMLAELLAACREIHELLQSYEACEVQKYRKITDECTNPNDEPNELETKSPLWSRLQDTKGPNYVKNNRTVLMAASERNCTLIVKKLLLRDDLDVNWCDENGNTALHYAAKKGHVGVVELLLSDYRTDRYLKNSDGDMPFHLGCYNPKMAACFLHHNTNTQALNVHDQSVETLIARNAAIASTDWGTFLVLNTIFSEQNRLRRMPSEIRALIRKFAENVKIQAAGSHDNEL